MALRSCSPLLLILLLATFTFHGRSIQREVILIKIGGSSITNKGSKEELNPRAIDWFARTVARHNTTSFVIVHGAGSFGHFTAKEYGLKGRDGPPPQLNEQSDRLRVCFNNDEADNRNECHIAASEDNSNDKRPGMLHGLSATRLSVQKLNHFVVASLVDSGVPAIGISPCFGIPNLQAHGGDGEENLRSAVRTALHAGLVPVLHGDACLWGPQDVGILSGDTIMEILGVSAWVSRAIFLTDVDGVFTADPRKSADATLIRELTVDTQTGQLVNPSLVDAQESGHDHDVTGGLKTKLQAAIRIVASGKAVAVTRCGTATAESVMIGTTTGTAGPYTRLIPK